MSHPAQRVTYEFDRFQVDPAQRLLRSRGTGEALPLTAKVFDTLLYLVEHRGELIEIDRAAPLTARYLVDVNEADWPELAELPRVGEILARRIVESRGKSGPFVDHDDLLRVPGIGPRTLEQMKPYLWPMPGREEVAGDGREQQGAL